MSFPFTINSIASTYKTTYIPAIFRQFSHQKIPSIEKAYGNEGKKSEGEKRPHRNSRFNHHE